MPESALTADMVKAEAQRLGFPLVGIAPADSFETAEERLVEWIQQGRHGEMAWIDEPRARLSCHPTELLPTARSLIAVGVPYADGSDDPPLSPLSGRVSRYARGEDYHDVMGKRLRAFVEALSALAGRPIAARIFVDAGALADREAASRAGLGFYGKNTCILTAPLGSYCFLGAVITDLALAPDAPIQRDCGRCRLCIDACPTGALVAPYQLDARRCIGYLTVELRGSIPEELREPMGQHVFGCDICQQVCPWNRKLGPITWPELQPRADVGPELDLPEILALDDEAFRARFRKTPVKRAKRRGLLRSAAIALGNSGDPHAVPALARALSDPEPLVRGHAAWALGHIGGIDALVALESAASVEENAEVQREIQTALARI